MLEQKLKNIVDDLQSRKIRSEVIKNYLKEYLQLLILEFIYTSLYRDLIFTGGSCLRVCYGLNRLSEDLDLDTVKKIDKKKLAQELKKYFVQKLQYSQMEISIKGKKQKIYLKFPILAELGLSRSRSESNKLYVKIEIEQAYSKKFQIEQTPVVQDKFSFFVKNYDLPTLMAGKICAILQRSFAKGKGDKIIFKGRDYYDLIWYLQKQIKPNMSYLKDILKIDEMQELLSQLDKKVEQVNLRYLKQDLENLFADKQFVDDFVKNFRRLYGRYRLKD
ncbi:MAG: nucleotidyl transferase AbiEii/AbiGii toxin family protein [Patescibacteria group bacterium]